MKTLRIMLAMAVLGMAIPAQAQNIVIGDNATAIIGSSFGAAAAFGVSDCAPGAGEYMSQLDIAAFIDRLVKAGVVKVVNGKIVIGDIKLPY